MGDGVLDGELVPPAIVVKVERLLLREMEGGKIRDETGELRGDSSESITLGVPGEEGGVDNWKESNAVLRHSGRLRGGRTPFGRSGTMNDG